MCIMEYVDFMFGYNIWLFVIETIAGVLYILLPIIMYALTNKELIDLCLNNYWHTFEILVPKAFLCKLGPGGPSGETDLVTTQCSNNIATQQKWFLKLFIIFYLLFFVLLVVHLVQLVLIASVRACRRLVSRHFINTYFRGIMNIFIID